MDGEVAEGVYRLGDALVNFYLVLEGGKATVIDAGIRTHWRVLLPALARLELTSQAVEAVILTHAHLDHVGFAERARRRWHSTVYVHRADLAMAQTRSTRNQWGRLKARERLAMSSLLERLGALPYPKVAHAKRFTDGQTLDLPGRPRVIHMPGHTPGSAALLLAERGAVATGDAIVTVKDARGAVRPVLSPDRFNVDSRLALRSLGRLAGARAGILLPGHGESFRGDLSVAIELAREAGIWAPDPRDAGNAA